MQKIAPEENFPRSGSEFCLGLASELGMGAIFLEPNSSIEHNVFLDLTKTALLVPLDEEKFQIFDHFKHVFKNL